MTSVRSTKHRDGPLTSTNETPVQQPQSRVSNAEAPLSVGSLKVFNAFTSGAIAAVKIVAIAGNLRDPPFVAKIYRNGLTPTNDATPDPARIKFDREYDVVRRSVHPNIVKLHKPTSDCPTLGMSPGRASRDIICLELMDLGSLKHVLTTVRPQVQQPEHLHEFAKAVAVPCLLGLQYLHAHDFKHRDVKPENILLSKEGRVKWCDFDCCRDAKADTAEIGTNGYMAPEIFLSNGDAYTEKVDLWSLGCTLYWIVTNETPVASLSIQFTTEKFRADTDWQPREVFDLANTVHDPDLRDLLFHLLETNPDKRYNSFEALRHRALSKYYRGPGVIPRDDKYKKLMAPFTQHNLPMDTVGCTEESELDVIVKLSKGEYGQVTTDDRSAMKNSFKVLTYSRQKPAMDHISQFLGSCELPCLVEPAVLAAWHKENETIARVAPGAGSHKTAVAPTLPPSLCTSIPSTSTTDEACGN